MKIIFMGTPDFAVPTLKALIEAGHDVKLVLTQPDAVRDRGKKVKFSPVKEAAIEAGVPVLQPVKLRNDAETIEAMRKCDADAIVVAAFGQILSKEVLEMPRLGCLNVHGSLLPKYRGAAPIQRAVLDGQANTGVTIMQMAEGLDTGDMLAKVSTAIGKKTGGDLHDELSLSGARLLVETLDKLDRGEIIPEKQDDALSCYAPMISKKDGEIDFSKSPEEIERMIRAYSPWPGAYTFWNGEMLKLWAAEALESDVDAAPGTVISSENGEILVACGGEILKITELQAAGKKRMDVEAFLRGKRIEKNTVLG